MRLALSIILAASVGWGVAGGPQPVRAEDTAQTAAARAHFETGVAEAKAKHWAEAADAFERAYALRSSPAILYNWANALIETGALVEGAEKLRAVLRDGQASAELQASSRQALDELTPRLANLTITVHGDSTGVTLTLDAQPLPATAWGHDVPVNPGAHEVVALRDTEAIVERDIEVQEGQRAPVNLEIPPPPAAVAQPAASPREDPAPARTPEPEDTEPNRRKGWRSPWLWTAVVAAVAAGVVVGATVGTDGGGSPSPTVEGSAGTIRW